MAFKDNIKKFQDQFQIEDVFTLEFARQMDSIDELKEFREDFTFPKTPNNKPPVYLCGNSLGLQPKNCKTEVITYLDKWANEAVEGHFTGKSKFIVSITFFYCKSF